MAGRDLMKGALRLSAHGRASKHTVYFELLDACKKGGCPICTMALDTVGRYLDTVIAESVNDPPTRDAFVAARGYCNDHSWQLQAMQGGVALGAALLYRDVLRHAAEHLAVPHTRGSPGLFSPAPGAAGLLDRLAGRSGRHAGGYRAGVADPHTACPACHLRQRYELIYLDVLLDHIGEDELVQVFRGAGGLCLVHLDQAGAATRDAGAMERLIEIQRDCMSVLHEELSEFIRKHDYRFSGEGMGAEGNSWLRAIEMVAGKPGIR